MIRPVLSFFPVSEFLASHNQILAVTQFVINCNKQALKSPGKILSTVEVLAMNIFLAKETMGSSLTSSALDSSQKFAPEIMKNQARC
jgi:hypothetical protein